MPTLLIVEDDPLIGSFVEEALRAHGFATRLVEDGDQALAFGMSGEFDLIVLDMALPLRDGFDVLQQLRARGNRVPVIVLTGRTERDAVACLEGGADDYMRKPFHIEELLARVRTRLRSTGTEAPHVLRGRNVELDLNTRLASVGDRSVELTAREFALLCVFLRQCDQVLTREQLLSDVWGYAHDPTTNLVNVYVNSLRKKLGQDVIETVRGAGYRLSRASGSVANDDAVSADDIAEHHGS